MYFSGIPNTGRDHRVDQGKHISTSCQMIPDADWKNYQMLWKIEWVGRSVSTNAEQARPDDAVFTKNIIIYKTKSIDLSGYEFTKLVVLPMFQKLRHHDVMTISY